MDLEGFGIIDEDVTLDGVGCGGVGGGERRVMILTVRTELNSTKHEGGGRRVVVGSVVGCLFVGCLFVCLFVGWLFVCLVDIFVILCGG